MKSQQITQICCDGNIIKYYQPTHDYYDRDIIPGVYEGGFKVWQCTIDLFNYMLKCMKSEFIDKTVMDLGCGHGLLGIAALKLGAKKCIFQDYNQDVLEKITIPNIKLNQISEGKYQMRSGDWDQIITTSNQDIVDLIIGSEVIYREQNYSKIVQLCKRILKEDGKALLANKHYYFGVGGNMPAFKDYIAQEGLGWQSLEKIVPEKGGNKKQIISLFLKAVI